MTEEALKPCPFCGAPAMLASPDHEIEVHCTECAAKVENAPEFWNTRSLATEPGEVGLREGGWEGSAYEYGVTWGPLSQPGENAELVALREALKLAEPIVEADYNQAKEYADADWEGMSHQALMAVRAALSATPGEAR